jgi:phosphopantothenate---cysteine ligase (ATP)
VPAVSRRKSTIGSIVADDEPLDPKSLPEGDPDVEIEGLIIPAVEDLHTEYIKVYEEKGRV